MAENRLKLMDRLINRHYVDRKRNGDYGIVQREFARGAPASRRKYITEYDPCLGAWSREIEQYGSCGLLRSVPDDILEKVQRYRPKAGISRSEFK